METMTLKVIGRIPLLMNNPSTINPLSPASKAIKELTGKRTKTDADQLEIMRLKYEAALYIDDKGPYAPSTWLWKAGHAAAKKSKMGKMWEEAVTVREFRMPLEYNGPKTVDGLYGDGSTKFVNVVDGKIGTSRVTVVRPIFPDWSLQATLDIDDEVLNPRDALAIMKTAGIRCGLGTWRQQYGKFNIELMESSTDLKAVCSNLDIPMRVGK